MRYGFLPFLMWFCYKGTFRKQLSLTLNESDRGKVMKSAHRKYKSILKDVDEFEKGDRFLINILSCALLSSVLLSLEHKYSLEEIRDYYHNSMCTNLMTRIASKKSRSYTEKGRAELKKQAEASQKNRNPYSWIFKVEDGKTINQYTATFYTCGICHLMEKLGLKEYIPAMCTLDYDMAELNHTLFTRSCTLTNGITTATATTTISDNHQKKDCGSAWKQKTRSFFVSRTAKLRFLSFLLWSVFCFWFYSIFVKETENAPIWAHSF